MKKIAAVVTTVLLVAALSTISCQSNSSEKLEKAKTDDAVSIVKVKYDILEAIKESIGLLKEIEFNSDKKILVKSLFALGFGFC